MEEEPDMTSADLSAVMWIDKAWLSFFPLNSMTAMDYFALSPFYIKSSSTEIVRQQRLDPSVLLNMTGIEYSLASSYEPVCFIIQKSERKSPALLVPQESYCILNGNVFQAPCVSAVLSVRLLHSMYHFQKAFLAMQHKTVVTPRGYKWKTGALELLEKEGIIPDLKRKRSRAEKEDNTERTKQHGEDNNEPKKRKLESVPRVLHKRSSASMPSDYIAKRMFALIDYGTRQLTAPKS